MYLEGIPDLMCPVIRQVEKPVLAYKILAAGRLADRPAEIEKAFEYAFRNIKPTDGVIVGMFPKFRDQVTESAEIDHSIRYEQLSNWFLSTTFYRRRLGRFHPASVCREQSLFITEDHQLPPMTGSSPVVGLKLCHFRALRSLLFPRLARYNRRCPKS